MPSHRASSEPQGLSSPRAAAAALKALERDGSPNGGGGSGAIKGEFGGGLGVINANGGGRRRRGRPPRADLAANGVKKSSGAAGHNAALQESNLMTRQRPHRSARKAQLYNNDEFDLDLDDGDDIDTGPAADILEDGGRKYNSPRSPTDLAAAALAHNNGNGSGSGSGGEGKGGELAGVQPSRRRRKSPAPTDVAPLEIGHKEHHHHHKHHSTQYTAVPAMHVSSPVAIDEVMPSHNHTHHAGINANGNGHHHHGEGAGTMHAVHHYEDAEPAVRRKKAATAAAVLMDSSPRVVDGYGYNHRANGNGAGNFYEEKPSAAAGGGASGRAKHRHHNEKHHRERNGHGHGNSSSYYGMNTSNSLGRSNSIATAEQMFGELLGAIGSRLGKKGAPSRVNGAEYELAASLERDEDVSRPLKWSWAAIKGAPTIMNVDADLLRAALPRRSSLEASEEKLCAGGKKPAVPLFC